MFINYLIMFAIIFVAVFAAKAVFEIVDSIVVAKYFATKWKKFLKDNPEAVDVINKLTSKLEKELEAYISDENNEE